ncbi:MAG: ATP-binding cassette domain-containing protein [Bacteroidota bacterium]
MKDILVTREVTKRFGTHTALHNVSLEIPRNSIYGLLGPNGAGKTTLIRIINQITHPDQGTVFFDGVPLAPHHIAQIGYLPEERGLYKSMKVGEQALYLAQLKGLSKAEAKKRLRYWFQRLGITGWWHKKIQELSKGMAQKIQFIVTVLHEPKLLIFDEPFSGFDPINANIIKDEILRLRDGGTSIIFSTHRMESVEELCEHIALLHKSEKILDGKLSDIKKAYKSNIFDVSIDGFRAESLMAELQHSFTIGAVTQNALENSVDFTVQLPSGSSGDFLGYLSDRANVTRFVETVPTANEIFIKTVESKESNE